MPYTLFRYIAYEVPTATYRLGVPNSQVESGFLPGNACPMIPRLPVPAGLPDDANIRLRRLAAVVDRAAQRVQPRGDDESTTLKIFVAPEFYFRPPAGPNRQDGPYRYNTYPQADLFKIWGAFDSMFRHGDFTNWLFIPGTVMWNNSDDPMFSSHPNYFNSAFHILGGPPPNARQGPALRIEKKLPSPIDGLTYSPDEDLRPYAPGNYAALKPIYEEWRNRKERIFSLNGTYFGLEVCLDHGNYPKGRVLKTLLCDWMRTNSEHRRAPDVSLHILTAGGMRMDKESIAAKKNGYILRNDGLSGPPHSELRQIRSYKIVGPDLEVGPSNLLGTAELGDSAREEHEIALDGDELVSMKGAGYCEFPQRLVIYPRQELPHP